MVGAFFWPQPAAARTGDKWAAGRHFPAIARLFLRRTSGVAKRVGRAGRAEVDGRVGFTFGRLAVSCTLAESAMLHKWEGKWKSASAPAAKASGPAAVMPRVLVKCQKNHGGHYADPETFWKGFSERLEVFGKKFWVSGCWVV